MTNPLLTRAQEMARERYCQMCLGTFGNLYRIDTYLFDGELWHEATNEQVSSVKCEANYIYAQLLEAQMGEWISAEDKLPKHDNKTDGFGVEVLVYPRDLNDGTGATAYYGNRIHGKRACFYKYGAEIHDVTHWRPLPPAPIDGER